MCLTYINSECDRKLTSFGIRAVTAQTMGLLSILILSGLAFGVLHQSFVYQNIEAAVRVLFIFHQGLIFFFFISIRSS